MGIESDRIWMDGKLVPFAEANVHVLSHTLHYGLGAFEGIRAYEQPDGRAGVWRLDEHVARLFDSLKMARLPMPWTQAHVREACLEVLVANNFTSAYIRPLAFLGMGPWASARATTRSTSSSRPGGGARTWARRASRTASDCGRPRSRATTRTRRSPARRSSGTT
jgi:branched-subunit amino acid aminotransferase/4-amino-4-deoxychorismate lyase